MKKLYKIFGNLYGAIIFLFFAILICFVLTQFIIGNSLNFNEKFACEGDFCDSNKQSFNFKIDKKSYSFGDTIKLKIDFNNFAVGENIGLRVKGIKAKNGLFKINKSRQVEIKGNPYQIIYNVKVPYCSKCSGIGKGKHSLEVAIIKNGKIIESKNENIILK
ncbi:MAG: hypothetical protein U9O55_01925 [Patescibacteria group bacterium]|nr:hypothetical protein [Patescibacteria group bacterium]